MDTSNCFTKRVGGWRLQEDYRALIGPENDEGFQADLVSRSSRGNNSSNPVELLESCTDEDEDLQPLSVPEVGRQRSILTLRRFRRKCRFRRTDFAENADFVESDQEDRNLRYLRVLERLTFFTKNANLRGTKCTIN